MEKYKLSMPIEFDGEKITEINMDLEGLSAADLEKAERQARMLLAKKESMHVPETNKKYLSCVASRAAGVKYDLIRALRGKDYTQLCLLVQNFFPYIYVTYNNIGKHRNQKNVDISMFYAL